MRNVSGSSHLNPHIYADFCIDIGTASFSMLKSTSVSPHLDQHMRTFALSLSAHFECEFAHLERMASGLLPVQQSKTNFSQVTPQQLTDIEWSFNSGRVFITKNFTAHLFAATISGVRVAHWQHTSFRFQGTIVKIPLGKKKFSSFIFEL